LKYTKVFLRQIALSSEKICACLAFRQILEAVPITEVFRFARQNCRWQGEKSREYLVYFKIFQRSQRQFGPQRWVLRRLVQLLKQALTHNSLL
jgi:hypothetical protein